MESQSGSGNLPLQSGLNDWDRDVIIEALLNLNRRVEHNNDRLLGLRNELQSNGVGPGWDELRRQAAAYSAQVENFEATISRLTLGRDDCE